MTPDPGLSAGRRLADELAGTCLLGNRLVSYDKTYEIAAPTYPEQPISAPDVSIADAMVAVDAANKAQSTWARSTIHERLQALEHLADYLAGQRDAIAELIVVEAGKPIREAEYETDYAIRLTRAMGTFASTLGGQSLRDQFTGRPIDVQMRPVGPALLVSPWNFPLSLGLRKVVTALLAGCTCIWKPSERTPLSALAVAAGLATLRLPEGTVSVLSTARSAEVVEGLLHDGRIRKLSFTGSTAVGRRLATVACEQLVRTSLELGGNNAFIVGEAQDLSRAVEAVFTPKFANSGQTCTSVNRALVPSNRVDEFLAAAKHRLTRLRVGAPGEPTTDVGPLITVEAAERVRLIKRQAADDGGSVLAAAEAEGDGHFVTPAIANVTGSSSVIESEIFGPLLPVVAYHDVGEAVAIANRTPYGLSAYVYSDDPRELDEVAGALDAGMVGLNGASVSAASSPFGGRGWSGEGRENGSWGLHGFLEPTAVLR